MWDPYSSTAQTPYDPALDIPASSSASPESGVPGERLTAEEKRLRNNSASARFRVKKKIQEQQLVHDTNAAAERLTQLEGKAQELERENKWLKNLVLEKSKIAADKATKKNPGQDKEGSQE